MTIPITVIFGEAFSATQLLVLDKLVLRQLRQYCIMDTFARHLRFGIGKQICVSRLNISQVSARRPNKKIRRILVFIFILLAAPHICRWASIVHQWLLGIRGTKSYWRKNTHKGRGSLTATPNMVTLRIYPIGLRIAKTLKYSCHRSLQNQPAGVESKPATPRCFIHIGFLDVRKGLFNYFESADFLLKSLSERALGCRQCLRPKPHTTQCLPSMILSACKQLKIHPSVFGFDLE